MKGRKDVGYKPGSVEDYRLHKTPPDKRRARNRITPKLLIRAIKGTAGSISEIARRLQVNRASVSFCIRSKYGEGWDRVRKAYESECESVLDLAEKTVVRLIKQKKDLTESGKNSRWILEKKRRQTFGDSKTVILEGGDKPLSVQQSNVITLDVIEKLPIKVKRMILQEIEKAQDQADKKGSKKGE